MKKNISLIIPFLIAYAASAQQYEIIFFFEPLSKVRPSVAPDPQDGSGPMRPMPSRVVTPSSETSETAINREVSSPVRDADANSRHAHSAPASSLVSSPLSVPLSAPLAAHRGVLVEYAGYWTASDHTGKVSLLREQSEPVLYIIVANQVKAVIYHGQTVDYFIFNDKKASVYKAELQKDSQKEQFFWDIQKATLPNKRIPPNSILIFNDPSFIDIEEGKFLTIPGPNWILPPIHVRANIFSTKQILSTLDMLNINPYFRRINQEYQESKDRYASILER